MSPVSSSTLNIYMHDYTVIAHHCTIIIVIELLYQFYRYQSLLPLKQIKGTCKDILSDNIFYHHHSG